MPDDRDTDPDIAIPEEEPTRPDLAPLIAGSPNVICPACHGEGRTLDLKEWGTQHRAVTKPCGLCHGKKVVSRSRLAEINARHQGRPPRQT
jgi:hypothetical protein